MKRLSETARQTSSLLKTDDMRREHRIGMARKFPEKRIKKYRNAGKYENTLSRLREQPCCCHLSLNFFISTELGKKACTWFGEICSCSCLPVLPGSAGDLLSRICKPYFRALYMYMFSFSVIGPCAKAPSENSKPELELGAYGTIDRSQALPPSLPPSFPIPPSPTGTPRRRGTPPACHVRAREASNPSVHSISKECSSPDLR